MTGSRNIEADDPAALERAGWDALSSGPDAARTFYEQVLDDEVLMLLPGGLVLDDRAAIIEAMAGPPWSSFTLQDVRCTPIGGDGALVAYAVDAERDAQRYSALMSSLYAKRGDEWRLVFHQQTPR